ncbi:MAG: TatD family hydrolase, partial [Armatimonadetes bacterium]|nr:TatD family hydrolase [Anaerolineae bacterium]
MSLIDTHCHLDFDAYDADRDAVLERAAAADVTRLIIPAVDLETSQASLRLSAQYPGTVYGTVGVHPNSTADFNTETVEALRGLASSSTQVVAVGEIGLDYHWDTSPKAAQRAAFEAQLALAAELGLPVIIHNRDASEDVLVILESWVTTLPPALKALPGVLHSFSA